MLRADLRLYPEFAADLESRIKPRDQAEGRKGSIADWVMEGNRHAGAVLIWSWRRHLGGSIASWKPALRAKLGHYRHAQTVAYTRATVESKRNNDGLICRR
jgi:hypothetical protein